MRSNMPSIDFSSFVDVIVMVGGDGVACAARFFGEGASRALWNNSFDVIGVIVDTSVAMDSVLGTESKDLLLFRVVITLSVK